MTRLALNPFPARGTRVPPIKINGNGLNKKKGGCVYMHKITKLVAKVQVISQHFLVILYTRLVLALQAHPYIGLAITIEGVPASLLQLIQRFC